MVLPSAVELTATAKANYPTSYPFYNILFHKALRSAQASRIFLVRQVVTVPAAKGVG